MRAAVLDELSHADLERLAGVIRERSGLAFGEARWPFLRNRAREVMARAGFVSVRRWVEEVVASSEKRGALYCELEEALQVHETSFFRYEEQYRALREHVLPALVRPGGPRVRICSVGCSTGEEAYSIAMTVRESALRSPISNPVGRTDARPQAERVSAELVDIVALDVSRQALVRAVAGTFPVSRLTSVPPDYRARYFLPTGDQFTVVPALRQMIRFRHHDVRRGFYIGKFDVIVCCNVLIYFTPLVKQQVLGELADSLTEGGYLFLGHAEGVTPPESTFLTRGLPAPFMYQRLARGPASVAFARHG